MKNCNSKQNVKLILLLMIFGLFTADSTSLSKLWQTFITASESTPARLPILLSVFDCKLLLSEIVISNRLLTLFDCKLPSSSNSFLSVCSESSSRDMSRFWVSWSTSMSRLSCKEFPLKLFTDVGASNVSG